MIVFYGKRITGVKLDHGRRFRFLMFDVFSASSNIILRTSRTSRTSMEPRWKESLLHKQNRPQKARRNRLPLESSSRQPMLTLVAMPITSFALGTWQVYRLRWKKELIERYSNNLRQDTIILPRDVGYFDFEGGNIGIIRLRNWIIEGFLSRGNFDMIRRC